MGEGTVTLLTTFLIPLPSSQKPPRENGFKAFRSQQPQGLGELEGGSGGDGDAA